MTSPPPRDGYNDVTPRKWKAEQAELIAVRDQEAETRRQEWKAEAAKELDSWHSKQEEVQPITALYSGHVTHTSQSQHSIRDTHTSRKYSINLSHELYPRS